MLITMRDLSPLNGRYRRLWFDDRSRQPPLPAVILFPQENATIAWLHLLDESIHGSVFRVFLFWMRARNVSDRWSHITSDQLILFSKLIFLRQMPKTNKRRSQSRKLLAKKRSSGFWSEWRSSSTSSSEEEQVDFNSDIGKSFDFTNETMLYHIGDLPGLCKEECVGVGLHDFKTSQSLMAYDRRSRCV